MASTAGLARVALLRGGQLAAVFKVFQGGLQFAQHRLAATELPVDVHNGGFGFRNGGAHR